MQNTVSTNHDGMVRYATGRSRRDIKWRNTESRWSEFAEKLMTTTRTRETFAHYSRLNKDDQGKIKDVGGFVCAVLKGGRRKSGSVECRTMLTLDADYANADFIPDMEMIFGCEAVIYSTHSHSPEKPRLRVVAPYTRPVTPDESKALSRYMAAEIGIDLFDDTTHEPERLMYWPSTSADGDFIAHHIEGPWLDPDAILRRHPEWKDASTWPESSRATTAREKHAEKQGDPREKTGVLGAFCRTYTVSAAIDKFLGDVYTACDIPMRYTYASGSAAAGLVIYDGDLFAFSHHGTDPAGGQLSNAFDLVRIHKFGQLDDAAKPDTQIHKLPSYQAMVEWALKDDDVRVELTNTKAAEAAEDFEAAPEETSDEKPDKWKAKLQYSDRGIRQTIHNFVTVLRNDPALKGLVAENQFTRRLTRRGPAPWRADEKHAPWSDGDTAALRYYLEHTYGLAKREALSDALPTVARENAFHPIRDYLDSLKWDGRERIDRVLVDYMGADDTAYTRAAARKWLIAAVSRIREPGCKFDNMIILVGPQGIGKSQFFSRLARWPDCFSDSVSRFDNTKDAMEQLTGKWILEIGELSGMRKTDVEHIKTFLSKQEDSYRPPYGSLLETFPRQCIFAGTTNRDDFLQDPTGNRRFWPVRVRTADRMWKELTQDTVDQMWAEADAAFSLGENLFMSGETLHAAYEAQEQYTERGGKVGIAKEFLDRLLPEGWSKRSIQDKLDWLNGNSFDNSPGVAKRETLSGIELFVECFAGQKEKYHTRDALEMTDILTQLGWTRNAKRSSAIGYGQQRTFTRQKEGQAGQVC